MEDHEVYSHVSAYELIADGPATTVGFSCHNCQGKFVVEVGHNETVAAKIREHVESCLKEERS